MSANQIDWGRHFDRAYCISHVTARARRRFAEREFRRIGLLDSGIFRWEITYPDPWEQKLMELCPKVKGTTDDSSSRGFLNLGLASCRLMREAIDNQFCRVLFLEDDVRFLNDLDAVNSALNAIPYGYEVVQFDKFADWGLTNEQYQAMCADKSVNEHYFDVTGKPWYSGGCFMATTQGMANMLRAMEELRPGPMDSCFQQNGNRNAAAKRNLAVQIMMRGAMSQIYQRGRNTHHLGYAPQGIKYEDYAVPTGYNYDVEYAPI